jgi:hypothetical protein
MVIARIWISDIFSIYLAIYSAMTSSYKPLP